MDGMQQEGMTQGCLDDCHEIYYVKEEALKLLLAGLGQTQWYGLFSERKPHGSSVQEIQMARERGPDYMERCRTKACRKNRAGLCTRKAGGLAGMRR